MVAEDPEPVRPRTGTNEMHRAQCPWPVRGPWEAQADVCPDGRPTSAIG